MNIKKLRKILLILIIPFIFITLIIPPVAIFNNIEVLNRSGLIDILILKFINTSISYNIKDVKTTETSFIELPMVFNDNIKVLRFIDDMFDREPYYWKIEMYVNGEIDGNIIIEINNGIEKKRLSTAVDPISYKINLYKGRVKFRNIYEWNTLGWNKLYLKYIPTDVHKGNLKIKFKIDIIWV